MPSTLLTPPATNVASGGDGCADCGHEASGIEPARWVNKKRAKAGQPPVYAICAVLLHDYGFGDTEECNCENPTHAHRIR